MRILMSCLAAVVTVALAGCSGANGSAGAGPSSSYVPKISDEELLTLGKELVQCMRDNGVADMPDPYVEEHRLKVPEDEMDRVEEKAGQQVWDSAKQACQDRFDKIPQGALGEGGEKQPAGPNPEDIESIRKFAQCLRENGLPDWPDPDAEGRFPLEGTQYEGKKPEKGGAVDKAHEACRSVWSGPVGVS